MKNRFLIVLKDPLGHYEFQEAFDLLQLAEKLEGLTTLTIEAKNLARTLRFVAANLHPDCPVGDQDEVEGDNGVIPDEMKINYLIDGIRRMDEILNSRRTRQSAT
jgi:hypothetical protein